MTDPIREIQAASVSLLICALAGAALLAIAIVIGRLRLRHDRQRRAVPDIERFAGLLTGSATRSGRILRTAINGVPCVVDYRGANAPFSRVEFETRVEIAHVAASSSEASLPDEAREELARFDETLRRPPLTLYRQAQQADTFDLEQLVSRLARHGGVLHALVAGDRCVRVWFLPTGADELMRHIGLLSETVVWLESLGSQPAYR